MDLNKILIWNCRGAASPDLFKNCNQFIDEHRPEIFVIMETRSNPARLRRTFRRLGFDGFTFAENRGFAGGIVTGWKTDLVELLEVTNDFQFIHFQVTMQAGWKWFFTPTYASPNDDLRGELWTSFHNISRSMNGQWLIAGDLNDIGDASEKKGGGNPNYRKYQIFKDRIQRCSLIDLGSVGPKFTWRGPRCGLVERLFVRLDRALCNDHWRVAFPNAIVKVLPRVEFSDHHPILVCLHGNSQDRRERPFRFESAWLTHSNFKKDMEDWWKTQDDFDRKLVSLEGDLMEWKRNTFGCVKAKKRSLLARLGGIQKQYHNGNANRFLVQLEKSLHHELNDILHREELMWYQRSRTQWLQDGDRNTKYYQIKAANRKRKNRIHLLRGDDGTWLDDEIATKVHVNNFFSTLFTEQGDAATNYPHRFGFQRMADDAISLIGRNVEKDEIEKALFAMKPWKAPGPDGFQAGFYHANWHLIANDFNVFINDIWQDPAKLQRVNSTDICLIPKFPKPEFVTQFRPISLCNVSYKVVTKVIVNRLKPFMPDIVSPYQTGFIPTRSIHENIVVAQELLHCMNKMRGRNGFFVVKVDLAKAYDRLRWSFIAQVLDEIGLPSNIKNIIMHGITSVQTNVLWNGVRSDFFAPQRGIRQGDPLSPYLFVLCMDRLTHLIAEQVEDGFWTPIRAGRHGPDISHLMFADDLLLFGKATEENMHSVVNTLETFCNISGQMVSKEKTHLFFSKNVPATMRNRLVHISGFRVSASMGKYLGVPLLGKCPRNGDFNYLVEKVRNKLSGWKAKHLSLAGRITLSKSVIQAIPVYSMMTTPIPKSCLNEIQRLQRGFIWGDTEETRRMHMIKWSTLILPKGLGGLGIRDLATMNRSCIMKMAWGIKTSPSSLWSQVLNGKYGRGTLVSGQLQVKANDSTLWKAISSCWPILNSIEAWSLGNGSTINLWKDKWINGNTRLVDHAPNIPQHALEWRVSDIVSADGVWNLDDIRSLVPSNLLAQISALPAPLPHDGADERYWPGGGSGEFTVALAYQHLSNFDSSLAGDCWERVWKLQVPERIRCFIWQILHGKLATKGYCGRWGNGDVSCHHCRNTTESIIHVLRDCPLAVSLWNSFIPASLRSDFYGVDVNEWLEENLLNKTRLEVVLEWCTIWATGCYYLWFWRNRQVHDDDYNRPPHPSRVIVQHALDYEHGKALNPSLNRVSQQVDIRWKAPRDGWVSINTDGAAKIALGVAGCGGVVRDSTGAWLGGFARRLFVSSAYLAELWGAMEGIKLALSKGFNSIELQMDSIAVVNCLNGSDRRSIAGHQLVRRIRQLLSCFSNVRILHIYREANKVADELASLGCTYDDGSATFDSPPNLVKLLFDADVFGVSTPRLIHL